MKLILAFVLMVPCGLYAQSAPKSAAPSTAQTAQKVPQRATVLDVSAESAEHVLARKHYEEVKHLFDGSQTEYSEHLRQDPRCKTPEVISHPVTLSSLCGKEMVGCEMPTCVLLLKLEKAREELERRAYQLEHVDECLKMYRDTIDKKISDLTTREVGQIKSCQSSQLFPPPTK